MSSLPVKYQTLPQSYFAEKWFVATAKKLKIKAKNPDLELTKEILESHLKHKFQRVEENWIEDQNDVTEYLDLILKTDCLIELENQEGRLLKIAVDVTLNPNSDFISSKIKEISNLNFQIARQKLGIDRHWVIVITSNYQELDLYQLCDQFYTAIDHQNCIDMIRL